MAKPPPTQSYFRITLRTQAVDDLGPSMAYISANPALVVEGCEHVTDVAAYKGNPKRDVSAPAFLEAWTQEHPTFTRKEVKALFKEDGRSEAGGYSAIQLLRERGVIKRLDEDGHYSRADVKAIAGPRKVAKPPPKKAFEKSGSETILTYMRRSHGRATVQRLEQLFTDEGRASNSVGPSIDKLLKAHAIKRDSSGVYELIKSKAKKKNVGRKKANGAAPVEASESEVTAHG